MRCPLRPSLAPSSAALASMLRSRAWMACREATALASSAASCCATACCSRQQPHTHRQTSSPTPLHMRSHTDAFKNTGKSDTIAALHKHYKGTSEACRTPVCHCANGGHIPLSKTPFPATSGPLGRTSGLASRTSAAVGPHCAIRRFHTDRHHMHIQTSVNYAWIPLLWKHVLSRGALLAK
jgi:hypothetical protein